MSTAMWLGQKPFAIPVEVVAAVSAERLETETVAAVAAESLKD